MRRLHVFHAVIALNILFTGIALAQSPAGKPGTSTSPLVAQIAALETRRAMVEANQAATTGSKPVGSAAGAGRAAPIV